MEVVMMCKVRIPLNESERRKVVKVARGKRTTVPKLLKSLALGQIETDAHTSEDISEEKKWEIFMEGVNGFTEDFMPNGREV
jgi:hypothetical protein